MPDDVRSYLTQALASAVKTAFPAAGIDENAITLETPKSPEHGDLAITIAMQLAKTLHMAPPIIAKKIMSCFDWNDQYVVPDPQLTKTIIGGYINLTLSPAYLHQVLRTVVDNPGEFGHKQTATPQKILFEFVSANPTGPMVVVNARAAAVGDVLARVFDWFGHTVETEFYVNDWGNQLNLLGKSVACRYWQKHGRQCEIPEEGYAGEYIVDLADEISKAHPEIRSMSDDQIEEVFRKEALERNVAQQKVVLDTYRVRFTRWFRESQLHTGGLVKQAGDLLERKGLSYPQDGAVWFKATALGDDKDRVIYRSDGTPTYILADIAYHAHKASRGYNVSYTFWGPDHHGHIPHLECSIKALDITKTVFKNLIIQQVNLIRDGQPYKMSKRKGDFITMDDLMEEVGVDAARYFFLMRRLSSHFDFDLDLAKKRNDENPVFYVQYAHARTCNLIKHAEAQGFTQADMRAASPESLVEPEETAVLKQLAEFPNMIAGVVQQLEPHHITSFAESLAAAFHHFYQKHRIVTENRPLSQSRLLLTMGVRNVLKNCLDILGVSAPEKM
jgi:arginyl-tRNA synthetase